MTRKMKVRCMIDNMDGVIACLRHRNKGHLTARHKVRALSYLSYSCRQTPVVCNESESSQPLVSGPFGHTWAAHDSSKEQAPLKTNNFDHDSSKSSTRSRAPHRSSSRY